MRASVLAAALGLLVASSPSGAQRRPVLDAPARAVQAYLELEREGAQLTEAGWAQLAALVHVPGPRQRRPMAVHETWFVMGTAPGATADRAEVGLEGRVNGEYDPRTGRYHTDGLPGPIKWRASVAVVRVDGQWKVAGPMPPPGVMWHTVLRHATELRDTTTDPTIKRNATLTVRALSKYR